MSDLTRKDVEVRLESHEDSPRVTKGFSGKTCICSRCEERRALLAQDDALRNVLEEAGEIVAFLSALNNTNMTERDIAERLRGKIKATAAVLLPEGGGA